MKGDGGRPGLSAPLLAPGGHSESLEGPSQGSVSADLCGLEVVCSNSVIYSGGPGEGPPERLETKVSCAGGQPGLCEPPSVKPPDPGLQGES